MSLSAHTKVFYLFVYLFPFYSGDDFKLHSHLNTERRKPRFSKPYNYGVNGNHVFSYLDNLNTTDQRARKVSP